MYTGFYKVASLCHHWYSAGVEAVSLFVPLTIKTPITLMNTDARVDFIFGVIRTPRCCLGK